MKTVGRISVVAICYLLSSYGILLSLMLIGMSGIKSLSGALVGLLILLAWVCHVIMSINWVVDKPAKTWVPTYGTLAGVLGFILWPMANSTINNFGITDIFRAAAMGIAFTLPCFLLAIYLVRFHLRARSGHGSSYAS
jgi:regulator of protease activity HflC (stomatin/prohibitin superfamily)